jgi:hypothetical protein
MATEAPEKVGIEPSPRHRRQAHSQSGRMMGRRQFLAGLGGLTAGLTAAAYGYDWLTSRPTPEQRPAQDYNIEIFDFPLGYKHDFMLPPHPRLAATDAGGSVEVSPGVYLVTLSDTMQGLLKGPEGRQSLVIPSENWINNMAVLFDENKQKVTFITGPNNEKNRDTSWIKPPPDNEERMINVKDEVSTYYWSQTPVVENGTVVLTLARNKPHKNDMWWDPIGTDIAFFRDGIDQPPEIIKLPRTDYKTAPYFTSWGAAVMQDGKQEWTYIAGSTEPRDNNPYNTKELRMARAPYGQMDNLQKWQFWNGKDWVGVDPSESYEEFEQSWKKAEQEAGTVIDYAQGLSQGYTMNLIDGKVVITTKNTDFLGETVDVFTGDSPTGPFKKHTLIDKEELQKLVPASHRPANGKSWTYLAYLHPEVPDPEKKNRMLLTFCISPDVERPIDSMRDNVNTYSRLPVWVDRNKILSSDAAKT